jgi:hypothetical protein
MDPRTNVPFDACLAAHGCSLPDQVMETRSMALIRRLLLESDRAALPAEAAIGGHRPKRDAFARPPKVSLDS